MEDEENDRSKRNNDPRYDPLHRTKPLYSQIQEACQTFYQPRKNVSIDERMVASKARIGMKQYMKDKPKKWGYKLWVLADSSNGYTYRFSIYAGRRTAATERGLTFDVVDSLMQPLLNQGYNLFTDNFYSSPDLFAYLFENGTLACGTVRENRRGYPKLAGNGFVRADPRGHTKWLRNGHLLFVKWRDTRDVNVLSTIHSGTESVPIQRNTKDPVTREYVALNLLKTYRNPRV